MDFHAVHRDLKPVHILVSTPDKLTSKIRAVISSFSQSKKLSDSRASNRTYAEGASGYTAYEVLQRRKFHKAADIFSLGCIYYFVISNGEALFYSDFDVLSRPPVLQSLTDRTEMKITIENMTHKDPAKRPNCLKILTSSLFLDYRNFEIKMRSRRQILNDSLPANVGKQNLNTERMYSAVPIDIPQDVAHNSSGAETYAIAKNKIDAKLSVPLSSRKSMFLFRRSISPEATSPVLEVEPNIIESCDLADGPYEDSGTAEFTKTQTDFVISKITYNFKSILGVGPRGTIVFKGQFDGRNAAIMRLDKHFSNLIDEKFEFLISNSHPNLLPYYGKEENKRFYYLAMEECQGSLTNYILYPETFKGGVIERKTLLLQITEGLKYLHDNQLIHNNINPYNVLITHPNKQLMIKTMISDFGIDIKSHTGKRKLGFPGFNSLEVVETNTRSKSSDIFSLGCVYFYIMSKGNQLFYSDFDVIHRRPDMNQDFPGFPKKFLFLGRSQKYKFDRTVRDLIQKMISKVPDERPTCEEILNSPLFSELVAK